MSKRSQLPSKRSRPSTPMPWTEQEFKDRMLEAAGITKEERARALRKAWDKAVEALDATKTELVTFQGGYQKVEVPDNAARAKAREQIFKVTGADGAAASPVTRVEMPAPPWLKRLLEGKERETIEVEARDVTPGETQDVVVIGGVEARDVGVRDR